MSRNTDCAIKSALVKLYWQCQVIIIKLQTIKSSSKEELSSLLIR